MKSKLENLYASLQNAVIRFQDALRQEKNEYMRDSAIQRFEFTFELTWKTLKAYLEQRKGIRVNSPRDAFREAFQVGLIEDDPRWLQMIDTRNATSHIYNEAMAEGVYRDLPQYLPIIEKLVKDLGSD